LSRSTHASKRRRLIGWQIALAAAILVAIALRNAFSELTGYARFGDSLAIWEPLVWEFSSILMLAALIPGIVWLNRRFPVACKQWYRMVPIHLAATLPFSIVHVAGMVGLRKLAYAIVGGSYHFGPILSTWVYEYRKDFVGYWLIILFIAACAYYRRARLGDAGKSVETPAPVASNGEPGKLDRLVARKLNREFILDPADIARIESGGNYLTVHANATTYRLRGSLAGLAKRLDERRFVQIHRSQIVNIDHIREIQPWNHGDYRVLLKDGSFVNFSRRYRARLDGLLNCAAIPAAGNPARP
jgi:hypothetical protein